MRFDPDKFIFIENRGQMLDDLFIYLYYFIKQDKFGEYFFCSNNSTITEAEFVNNCKKANFYIGLYDGYIAGVVWVTPVKNHIGVLDYFIFPKFRGGLAKEIAKSALNKLLNNKWFLIIGLSPACNIAGTKFLSKIGMTIIGTMKDTKWFDKEQRYTDTIVSYIRRDI